jgi:hypothetical protein
VSPLKNILSHARTAMRRVVADHPDAVSLAASTVRCATMVVEGAVGTRHPAVVGVCAAINLTVDYLELRLAR